MATWVLWVVLAAAGADARPLLDLDGFAFTSAEGQACSEMLARAREEERGPSRNFALPPSSDVSFVMFRNAFVDCVKRRRKFVASQADLARADAAFERTADEESACARVLAAARAQSSAEDFAGRFVPCVEKARAKAAEANAAIEREHKIQAVAEAFAANPKVAQSILSAMACARARERSSILADIAKEKRYSRVGGVVNLDRRSQMQDDLAAVDDEARAIRDALRETKKPPLGCKLPAIAKMSTCFTDDPDPECQTPASDLLLRAAKILVSY